MNYQGKDCCESGGMDDVRTDMEGVLHSSEMDTNKGIFKTLQQ